MTKKKTHEEYELQLFENEIDFVPLEPYTGKDVPILHECINGHIWKVRPSSIVTKRTGCPECSKCKPYTTESYREKLEYLNIKHIVLEPYKGINTKIKHLCSGCKTEWMASPSKVISGQRCSMCGGSKKLSNENYLEKLRTLNLQYKPLESYINTDTPINHSCLKCANIWKVSPSKLYNGRGCPKCAKYGFNPTKAAVLYFVSFIHDEIMYYKLGITSTDLRIRFKGDWLKYSMRELWSIHFTKGYEAKEMEQKLLKEHSIFSRNTGLLKSGNTETFTVYINKPVLGE